MIQASPRRFRPATFDDIVGQDHVCRTLKNAITQGRIQHAYLFAGTRGTGKTSAARILAKALNCLSGPTIEPCLECDSCIEIAAFNSIDVQEMDAASHSGVDDIKDSVLNSIATSPARDRYRIIILDEVHQLSPKAFDALLKTLEEPPPHVVFVLATTELHKIPETVQSRCWVFEFRRLSTELIAKRLRRIIDATNLKVLQNQKPVKMETYELIEPEPMNETEAERRYTLLSNALEAVCVSKENLVI